MKLRFILALVFCATYARGQTVTHRVTTSSTTNATSYVSGAFTPAAGDLLVAMVMATGDADFGVMSDSQTLGWDRVCNPGLTNASADRLLVFVSQKTAANSSMTVTFTTPVATASGTSIFVASVSSITRKGADAVRQCAQSNNQSAAGTPATTFSIAVLTGNPTFTFVGDATNPATVTGPTGWTAETGTGYATPTTGAIYAHRDSGFTGTTITWGGTSASAFGVQAFEMDTSTAVTSGIPALSLNDKRNVPDGVTKGNTYKFHLPNPVLVGNTVLCGIGYNNAVTVSSVADDASGGSNTWTADKVQASANGGTPQTIAIWRGTMAKAAQVITFTFSAITDFQVKCTEFYDIKAVSPVDVTAAVQDFSASGTSIFPATASMTTTVNGDLIFMWGLDVQGPLNESGITVAPTGFFPQTGFTLLSGGREDGGFSAYRVQTTAGPIIPAMKITAGATDTDLFEVVAVAYKADGAQGIGPSTSALRVTSMDILQFHSAASITENFPCVGNGTMGILFADDVSPATSTDTAVSDSINGSGYTQLTNSGGISQLWKPTSSLTTSPNMTITVTRTAFAGSIQAFLCVQNYNGVDTGVSAGTGSVTATGSLTSPGNTANAPSITPVVTTGFTLSEFNIGNGPEDSLVTPASVEFMNTPYTGDNDTSQMNSGDAMSLHYFTTTAAQNYVYHVSSTQVGNAWNARATVFKAPPSTGALCTLTVLGAGPC
jgi:hypothetical protein